MTQTTMEKVLDLFTGHNKVVSTDAKRVFYVVIAAAIVFPSSGLVTATAVVAALIGVVLGHIIHTVYTLKTDSLLRRQKQGTLTDDTAESEYVGLRKAGLAVLVANQVLVGVIIASMIAKIII